MKSARLGGADLTGADLRGADLKGCDFSGASLASCNLGRANLLSVRFDRATLAFADFNRSTMGYTVLTRIDDLHLALRLECVRHRASSVLDEHTLAASEGMLPSAFVRGIRGDGPDVAAAISRMPSCFISHAAGDASFADRLYNDLRRHGVLCWHFAHDLKGGLPWRDQIDDAIVAHERLVLVCSRQAIYRENVVREVLKALENERATGARKLFPLRLDDHILSDAMLREAREKVRSGEWPENWVHSVRELQVLDFSGWRDASEYSASLSRLVDSLRAPSGGTA